MSETNLLCILLSDNDEGNISLLSEYSKNFAKLTCVKTLTSAIEYLNSHDEMPDVILLGMNLSDSTCINAIEKIHEICSSPILIIADEDNVADAEDVMIHGADDYLIKSNIDASVLFRRIKMVFGKRKYLMSRCANGNGYCFNHTNNSCELDINKVNIDRVLSKIDKLNKIFVDGGYNDKRT